MGSRRLRQTGSFSAAKKQLKPGERLVVKVTTGGMKGTLEVTDENSFESFTQQQGAEIRAEK